MNFKEFFEKLKLDPLKRTKLITLTTMLYNFFWAIGKILFGVFKNAYVYILSGGYTILIGFSKRIFLKSHNRKDINKETKSIIMAVLLMFSGLAFALFMGRLFFWPYEHTYGLIWSIGIAVGSFVELGIAIFNLFRVKKKNDILLLSLRSCSFISAVFAIVITQISILSATGTTGVSIYNAISGILAGLIAIGVGIIIIVKASKLKKLKTQNPQPKTQEEFEIEKEIDESLGIFTHDEKPPSDE